MAEGQTAGSKEQREILDSSLLALSSRLRIWLWVFLMVLIPCRVLSSQTFKVSLVIDGDTIVLSNGEHVRYIGINAPEIAHEDNPAEYYGEEAHRFNKKLAENKWVRLEYDIEKKDQYGRLLAYVFLLDGTFLNGELVKYGYAYVLSKPPNLKYNRLLLELQQNAIKKKRGLWARKVTESELFYIGNKRSRRFHRPQCPYGQRIAPHNRIIFKNKKVVFEAGYSPCKRCRP